MELRGVRLRVQGLAAFSVGLQRFGVALMVALAPCNCDDGRLLV